MAQGWVASVTSIAGEAWLIVAPDGTVYRATRGGPCALGFIAVGQGDLQTLGASRFPGPSAWVSLGRGRQAELLLEHRV